MKKSIVFIFFLVLLAISSWCIVIDGKFWDWAKTANFYNCKPRALEKGRSGLDMQSVKISLGNKFLYIYIEGRSVTGLKPDRGWGARKTSVRISFKSSQSPLNRVRIATYPSKPGAIKISYPHTASKTFGSKKDKFWALAKYGNKYAFEVKIPFVVSAKGIHVGASGGPLIWVSENYGSSRKNLSDVLINTVDEKTHRLVDTVEFSIKKGEL